ncbi:PP2C family protein-serine/threonine phosphatase [Ruania albidiflava]|uniref:PP2C family protein-serine/threonine phosphatase n=1 Tax=Ruania albidiflava TaxID=366586 RepID=UPI0003B672DD|nr:protein phosphatase 2C domain-containing protein [Ruania albidiflava]
MAVSFRYAVRTDLGTVRTNNEDSAFASPRLLVLADGMGGHAAGEVASAVALRVFAEVDHREGAELAPEFLRAGRLARRALFAMSEADPLLESMGTTLVTVGSDGDRVSVGHIGDSRVYALRDGALYQLTTDHTHVQRLIDSGELTPERARTHPYRSMLLKSLDDQPAGPDLDIIEAQIEPGDRVLLCSDGLSDYLEPDVIGATLMAPDREQAAADLIEAALSVGTRDNVTVVVADVVTDDEQPDGRPPGGAPVVVGAAEDGVSLSAEAAAALRGCLPEVPFDATAPMAGVRGLAAASGDDQSSHTPVSEQTEEAALSSATSPKTRPTGPTGTATARSETAGAPRGTDPDVVPVPQTPSSSLPGVLAAAAVVVLVALLYLLLG